MEHNFLTYGAKIVAQIVFEFLYFPVWWYSVGFFRTLKKTWGAFRAQEQSLGFSVWVKNLFIPMYGQSDFTGRAISFVIRLVQIIARGLALFVWALGLLAFLLAWLALPILLIIACLWQLAW